MLKEIYTAAMGMLPQQTKLEVIANNMANAGTVGYKRASVFERDLIDARQNMNNTPGDVESVDTPIGEYTNFSQGAFRQTNNPLDIAIDDPKGFFVVQDGEGKQFFTRAGSFTLNSEGQIITPDGKKLLGIEGPMKLQKDFAQEAFSFSDSKAMKIRISSNGEFFANQKSIGNVKLVDIQNPETLKRVEKSLFQKSDETKVNDISAEKTSVRQGWIENSNVDIVREMVDMIELQRLFEIGHKVIRANDETLDQSFRVGRYQ